MKRSFRVYLFIQILVATAVIIVANRFVAQYFLGDQMQMRAQQEMARVVSQCSTTLHDEHQWRDCAQGEEKGHVLSPLVDFFELCSGELTTDTQACRALSHASLTWQPVVLSDQPVRYVHAHLLSADWHVMKAARGGNVPVVMLSEDKLGLYLQRLWELRDRNLIYVLPTIVVMLLVLTAYMVYVVMRPIRLMEETLSKLDFQTIREKNEIQTPYREFRKLAQVYRDLLKRLDESYENAKRFASDAAHELRTPLSILRGNVERLIPEVPNGSEMQRRLQNLGDEVDRLILITEKLLMLSRADSNSLTLDIESVDLSTLLTNLIEDAESFHRQIKFIQKIQPHVHLPCDFSLMEQLINNLYSNAIKYNLPQGGWVEFDLHRHGDEVVLIVSNASNEVSADLPEKAFERFYRSDASRTRRSVDGLGLGLSICREIAHAHHATLNLENPRPQVVSVTFRASVHAFKR